MAKLEQMGGNINYNSTSEKKNGASWEKEFTTGLQGKRGVTENR